MVGEEINSFTITTNSKDIEPVSAGKEVEYLTLDTGSFAGNTIDANHTAVQMVIAGAMHYLGQGKHCIIKLGFLS